MIIKSIEISRTFGGVISEAPYENSRPSFTDTIHVDLNKKDNEEEIRELYGNKLSESVMRHFDLLKNNLKAQLVELQFRKIRFREKDGKKYPSVTSITDWSKDFHVSEIDLTQYASRGTIIHYMVQKFIETGQWLTLREVAEQGLREDATILFRGGLQLKIEDCSHEEFFEQFGKDFTFDEFEVEVFNDQYLYSGRYDARGTFQGIPSIIDFKTGASWDFKQLAAYANCLDGIEQLVICPVGPNGNKTGVKKPVVTKNIKGAFDNFLKDRAEFQKRFGI